MKVMCVTKDYIGKWSSFSAHEMLTIGEWYEVSKEYEDYYTITLKTEYLKAYEVNLSKLYFKTVEQLREERLNKILI
jgi:hypothetical protein